jgi:Co/Zn/Cd efflux system component
MRFRAHSDSLTRAAFLSARNDVLANIAIIAAGSCCKSGDDNLYSFDMPSVIPLYIHI